MNPSLHEGLGAAFLLALCIASGHVYRREHRRRSYASGDRQAMPSPRGFAAVYAWIRWSTLVAGIGSLLWPHPAWLIVIREPWSLYAGAAIATIGFALFVGSKRALGRHYSPCYESYLPLGIVTDGPYQHVRHPIYTANGLLLAGLALLTGSLWLAANLALLAFYYGRSARAEERHLAAAHVEYGRYVARTGRFVPRLLRGGGR